MNFKCNECCERERERIVMDGEESGLKDVDVCAKMYFEI